jgi:hypothetical protein
MPKDFFEKLASYIKPKKSEAELFVSGELCFTEDGDLDWDLMLSGVKDETTD